MTVRLIGGEMVVWSDLDGTHGPAPVGGPALSSLARAVAGGRTLVAGPHDPALIDQLAGSTGDLVLLIRGIPDAEALAARYPTATVYCGGLEKLAPEHIFDTIIALDGLPRLSSVEGVELAWSEALDLLLAALAPDGTMLLGIENFLGLHRLVAVPPPYGETTDSDWVVESEYDPSRPAGFSRVQARLANAGLAVARAYAAYPGLLLGEDALAAPELAGYLSVRLRHAIAESFAGQQVLTDPAVLAASALRHGAAVELAPSWVFVASRGSVAVPQGFVGEDELTPTGVPVGRPLTELLLGAALRRDLPAVRELLTGYSQWRMAFIDETLVRDGGELTAVRPAEPSLREGSATLALPERDFEPSLREGSATLALPERDFEPVPLDEALHRFALSLIESRIAHPWPSTLGPVELAATMAAMAGHELDRSAIAVRTSGTLLRKTMDTADFQRLAAENAQLAQRLDEASAKLAWYEKMLTSRENSLKRAQRIIRLTSGSVSYRVGKALMGSARSAKRTARAVVRRIRPRT